MRKIGLAALALALILCLSACGGLVSILPGTELEQPEAITAENSGAVAAGESFQERPLLEFLSREEFGESYYTDTPVALSYQPTAEDGSVGCRSHVFGRAAIIAACDALRDMKVTGRAAEDPVSSAAYTLTMADGGEVDFTFGLLADGVTRVLSTYTGDYTVTGGDALWNTAFPAYSPDFDVFDLYFSDSVRAFADGFAENTPVSVSYRMNSGASITSTDPAAVAAAFEALAGAEVIVVENQPDANVDLNQARDYIFTMEDGSTYTFSFAQRCLAVTADAAFGPVYYWITGVDELWNVAIVPETEDGSFQGGALSGLREDTRRTAEVLDGGGDGELSIMSVFVEYSIGEESGYFALDGDKAADFVRRVCGVNVTAETADAPDGDRFTVSITLSDATGPILYFTGDTVQQVVGTNYLCDSGDMQALRDAIVELGSSGENATEIEEGGTE